MANISEELYKDKCN